MLTITLKHKTFPAKLAVSVSNTDNNNNLVDDKNDNGNNNNNNNNNSICRVPWGLKMQWH